MPAICNFFLWTTSNDGLNCHIYTILPLLKLCVSTIISLFDNFSAIKVQFFHFWCNCYVIHHSEGQNRQLCSLQSHVCRCWNMLSSEIYSSLESSYYAILLLYIFCCVSRTNSNQILKKSLLDFIFSPTQSTSVFLCQTPGIFYVCSCVSSQLLADMFWSVSWVCVIFTLHCFECLLSVLLILKMFVTCIESTVWWGYVLHKSAAL